MLYGVSFPVPADFSSKDFVLPIGKAKIEREGLLWVICILILSVCF